MWQLGGSVSDVAIDGNFAYVPAGAVLRIYQFQADPRAAPVLVGWTQPVTAPVTSIAVAAGTAWLGTDDLVLAVDLRDPQHPGLPRPSIAASADQLVARGPYLYAGRYRAVDVYDVTSPGDPKSVAELPAGQIALADSLVAVADTEKVTLFRAPASGEEARWQELGGFDLAGTYAVAMTASRLYALTYGQAGDFLSVYDLADPTAPTLEGSVELEYHATDVAAVGDKAYVGMTTSRGDVLGGGWGLAIVDTSDPTSPAMSGGIRYGAYTRRVAADGGRVLVARLDQGAMYVDASAGTEAVGVALYDLRGQPEAVAVAGKRLYAATNESWSPRSGQIVILDVTAVPPRVLGEFQLPQRRLSRRIAVAGPYLYVATEGEDDAAGALRVLDVSQPDRVRQGAVLPVSDRSIDLDLHGNYLYLASEGQVRVVDVADPRAPRVVAAIGSLYAIQSIAVADGLLYVGACGSCRWNYPHPDDLRIFSVSAPRRPRELNRFLLPPRLFCCSASLAVADRRLYVAGTAVIDATDPLAPRLTAELPGAQGAVTVAGDRLFVARPQRWWRRNGTVTSYRLDDPNHPREMATVPFAGAGIDLASGDDSIIVAAGDGGILGLAVDPGPLPTLAPPPPPTVFLPALAMPRARE